jgi:hypothetical protein
MLSSMSNAVATRNFSGMRQTYARGLTLLLTLVAVGCGGSDDPTVDPRAAYETVYGTDVPDGYELLAGICDGDEGSDEIFVHMADTQDDDRPIRALRLMCPDYVDQVLDG